MSLLTKLKQTAIELVQVNGKTRVRVLHNLFRFNAMEIDGRRFVQTGPFTYQCAYCLNLQPTPASELVRDNEGFALGVALELSSQHHNVECIYMKEIMK